MKQIEQKKTYLYVLIALKLQQGYSYQGEALNISIKNFLCPIENIDSPLKICPIENIMKNYSFS